MTAPRILVVEDDAPLASVLERGLGLAGYEVVTAEDGLAGGEHWRRGGFAAVVLDVMLPGLGGIELCRRLREAGDATPVILLTARDDDDLRAAGVAAGATAYVTKPFGYAELVSLIGDLTRIPSGSGSPPL
jgi:DNA-binding response OmpR family regulator